VPDLTVTIQRLFLWMSLSVYGRVVIIALVECTVINNTSVGKFGDGRTNLLPHILLLKPLLFLRLRCFFELTALIVM